MMFNGLMHQGGDKKQSYELDIVEIGGTYYNRQPDGTLGCPIGEKGLEIDPIELELFGATKAACSWLKKMTGGVKQWLRIGNSYSRQMKEKTWGIRWGAGKDHWKEIGNPKLQQFNIKCRNFKIPINSWRTNDAGHLHILSSPDKGNKWYWTK